MTSSKLRQRWMRTACVALLVLVFLFYRAGSQGLYPSSTGTALGAQGNTGDFKRPLYASGAPKAHGEVYTRTLIIARTTEEDVSWIDAHLSGDQSLSTAIYTVNESSPSGPFTVPLNKGHEAMPYLTYIIDNYDQLTDVSIFMHAHQITWHNNDLLDSDAARMVSRLSSARVVREGYMNLRCHHKPGCPGNLHPLNPAVDDSVNYPETLIIGQAWTELFPGEAVPETLSQACCAQFALSRERIRALPLTRYIFFRDWLLSTQLEDKLAGRVWEYVWQFVFAGVHEFCPRANVCYCDGYGICFGGETEYDDYFKMREEKQKMEVELQELSGGEILTATEKLNTERMRSQVEQLRAEMETSETQAFERGEHPQNRAWEAGRPWKEGDGF